MTKGSFLIIAGLTLIPSAASARADAPNAAALVRQLSGGWPGMSASALPQAPGIPAFVVVAGGGSGSEEVSQALAALIEEATEKSSCIGETVRRLGFQFKGQELAVDAINSVKHKHFAVTKFRGKTEIIIGEFSDAAGKNELRSYLLSTQGVLKAAALTTKPDGRFKAVEIDLTTAKPEFDRLLKFWIQYYRDNLKKEKA